jgi:acetyltransferase-like isoleucine patch superfamily enzyme/dTDP-4-dehydrorhamnose 3,5-epimerase-like enzyme
MSDYYLHPQGICESPNIGKGTRVHAFAHILPEAVIGEDCNVCDGVFIENDVVIGHRVTIKCGVQVWDGVTLEDDVFVGPNVTFTNDPMPRSKHQPSEFSKTRVCRGASLGANSTILPGITIGENAMVGAGAVVTKNVPPNAIVYGNPAVIMDYVGSSKDEADSPQGSTVASSSVQQTTVEGVTLHRFPLIQDLRGNLTVGLFEREVPFAPRRYFMVFDVPSKNVRGEHAHHECHQFLICVKGSCSVLVDDGASREEIRLDSPNIGLHVPPMIWALEYKHSQDCVLLVFASHDYDADDYIREYKQWKAEIS